MLLCFVFFFCASNKRLFSQIGDECFSSPDSVRIALAVVFATVYFLRSLPARGSAGFNPLVPCYRLLGFPDGETRSKQVWWVVFAPWTLRLRRNARWAAAAAAAAEIIAVIRSAFSGDFTVSSACQPLFPLASRLSNPACTRSWCFLGSATCSRRTGFAAWRPAHRPLRPGPTTHSSGGKSASTPLPRGKPRAATTFPTTLLQLLLLQPPQTSSTGRRDRY